MFEGASRHIYIDKYATTRLFRKMFGAVTDLGDNERNAHTNQVHVFFFSFFFLFLLLFKFFASKIQIYCSDMDVEKKRARNKIDIRLSAQRWKRYQLIYNFVGDKRIIY